MCTHRDNVGHGDDLGLHVFKAGKLHNFLLEWASEKREIRLQGSKESFMRLEDLLAYYGNTKRRDLPTRLEYDDGSADNISIANSLLSGSEDRDERFYYDQHPQSERGHHHLYGHRTGVYKLVCAESF